MVKIDGSCSLTLRNRKYLRKSAILPGRTDGHYTSNDIVRDIIPPTTATQPTIIAEKDPPGIVQPSPPSTLIDDPPQPVQDSDDGAPTQLESPDIDPTNSVTTHSHVVETDVNLPPAPDTTPMDRPRRERKPPAWHADYEITAFPTQGI